MFRGKDEEKLLLLSHKERLAISAKSGEHHVVKLKEGSQSGVTQENVSLSLDCWPLLDVLPGGNVQWKYIQLDKSGNIMNGRLVLHQNVSTFEALLLDSNYTVQ